MSGIRILDLTLFAILAPSMRMALGSLRLAHARSPARPGGARNPSQVEQKQLTGRIADASS
jgi:hypothetical protein